jgi:hypothetical protein
LVNASAIRKSTPLDPIRVTVVSMPTWIANTNASDTRSSGLSTNRYLAVVVASRIPLFEWSRMSGKPRDSSSMNVSDCEISRSRAGTNIPTSGAVTCSSLWVFRSALPNDRWKFVCPTPNLKWLVCLRSTSPVYMCTRPVAFRSHSDRKRSWWRPGRKKKFSTSLSVPASSLAPSPW